LSKTEAIIARQRTASRCDESSAMPQWAFEIFRPVVRFVSRVLWRIEFHGVENIPTDAGGFVIVANHQTYIDPFWVSIPIKKPTRYLAWSAAFDWFIVGRLMPLFGAWPLQIEGGETKPIRRAINWLRTGGAVMIFPEGGRGNPDGTMVRFKPGAARIALEAGVPVLPATIRGGHRVWSKDKLLPHLARVEIVYHPLQILTCKDGEDARACARRETARLASIIQSAL
jgi:1-acyl-sn-glycerol-3-phosphate acyltransferase